MPIAEWSGRGFSMQNVHPSTGKNPVTRVLNMVLASDGSLERRKDFDSGVSGSPLNHIVAELNGVTYLIIKTASGVSYSTGAGFTAITMASSDPPINAGAVHATQRGSFCTHGQEVYYCDGNTIFAWGGVGTTGRRPGVVTMKGSVYNAGGFVGGSPAPSSDATLNFPVSGPSTNPIWPTVNPGITPYAGEKTLNTGFCFSYYDPVRKIYGTRSEVFALPYVFGPPDPDGSNQILSDERVQFAKRFNTPALPSGHTDYKIAVWFTLGMNILTNTISTVFSGWFFYFDEHAPAMSKRMSETLFLEDIVEPSQAGLFARKDNATLVQSGRYLDVYERPVPAQFMVILSNGVAVYFYPWLTSPENGGSAGQTANHAEYSVLHPEQIGRDTKTQRDTNSPLPNLKGVPQAVVDDGDNRILLTKQAIYAVGFDGNVALRILFGGRGVRALNSIHSASNGVFWMADEGVCWMRGGQIALLDLKLGFDDWFGELSTSQREQVVIGSCDVTGEILMFTPDLDISGQRALVYNTESDFISEFKDFGTATYAVYFRSDSASQLWVWGAGKYPGASYGNYTASVEMWVNDGIDRPKQIKSVVVECGPRGGSITVAVEAHQTGETVEGNAPYTSTKTQTLTVAGNGAGRLLCPELVGMRGRLFKITVTMPSGRAPLNKVSVEYDFDEASDAPSL